METTYNYDEVTSKKSVEQDLLAIPNTDLWLSNIQHAFQGICSAPIPVFSGSLKGDSALNVGAAPLKWDDGALHEVYVPMGLATEIRNTVRFADGRLPHEEEVEACMVIVHMILARDGSNLDGEYKDFGKTIPAKIFNRLLGKLSRRTTGAQLATAKQLIDALELAGIIKVDRSYCPGEYSYSYSITEDLQKRARVHVPLKEADGYRMWSRQQMFNELSSALLWSYPHYTLPDLAQVKAIAVQLDANKVMRKGKRCIYALTNKSKRAMEYWVARRANDRHSVRILDEDIEQYQRLLKSGLPVPHDSALCPRVTDGFNRMASWIRELILIDGEVTCELDFNGLHPHMLYGLFKEELPMNEREYFENVLNATGDIHSGVAAELIRLGIAKDLRKKGKITSMDVADVRGYVKKEHLAYFNRRSASMNNKEIHQVYKLMPEFMALVRKTKLGRDGHKGTSKLLFALEVGLMTAIIRKFYAAGIHFIYVYDALVVPQSKVGEAAGIMNAVATELGLLTRVKQSQSLPSAFAA